MGIMSGRRRRAGEAKAQELSEGQKLNAAKKNKVKKPTIQVAQKLAEETVSKMKEDHGVNGSGKA